MSGTASHEVKCPECGRLIFRKGVGSHRRAHKRGSVVSLDDVREAQRMWDRGDSITEIARELGHNEGTLWGLIYTAGGESHE